MTIAALGSLHIVKDRVGITQLKKNSSDDTPDALVPYELPEERADRIKTQIDLRHFALSWPMETAGLRTTSTSKK